MARAARSLLSALFLVALFAAPGCADREVPTAALPAAAVPAFSQSAGSPSLERLATFKSRRSLTIAWAKKWIGPEGGRLDFAGFAIDVPAGAVDRVTMFTINLPVDPNGSERVMVEFGPHNQRFAKPVKIELPFQGTSIESTPNPTIVWWNDAWVNVGAGISPDGARLQTLTDHFSTYGTTQDDGTLTARGGVVTTSGG